MSDSLKSIETLIAKAKRFLLDENFDTPAIRDSLRLLEEQRQHILDDKRTRSIDGIYVTTKLVNGERVVTSGGGFSPDDRVISLAMALEQSFANIENNLVKKSNIGITNQKLSKEQRKLNTEKRHAKAMELIKKELGNVRQMTYEEFELAFSVIKPKPNIPLPKAKKLIQKTVTLIKTRRTKS